MTSSWRKIGGKRTPTNILVAPLDKVSFHSEESVQKWKFLCQRRIAPERELNKDIIEWKEIMNLLKDAGLMTMISDIGPCYEELVKEFILNLSSDCNVEGRLKYKKGNV